jgi:hypothetical protein
MRCRHGVLGSIGRLHRGNVRPQRTTIWTRLLVAALLAFAVSAQPVSAKMSSSRGYSLPSTSSSSSSSKGYSAPSASSPSSSSSSPSSSSSGARSSSGYALPGAAAPSATKSTPSASDAAISRQQSGAALKSFTAQREQAKFAAASPPASPPSGAFSGFAGRYSSYDAYYASRNTYYGGWGWAPPPYVYASRPSFGMWDALFMWFLLDSISNATHAAWFYNHADDPGYQQWRQEADRLAADNADLRAKLNALDAKQREMAGQPRDPSYMPPDAKAELALAPENAVSSELGSHGHPNWWLMIAVLALLACAGYAYMGHVRRLAHH